MDNSSFSFAGLHCGEIDMPEFIEFQLNAKKLTERLPGTTKSQQVLTCSFFPPLMMDKKVLQDACLISMVADALDKANDDDLIGYLQDQKEHSLLTKDEFIDFKTKALMGFYLLKWRQYDSLLTSYIYTTLIALFQNDLHVTELDKLSKEEVDACFEKLVQFCVFLNINQSNPIYKHLYNQLGNSIQLDIHKARYPKSSTSVVYDVVQAGMQSVGFKIA
jgi:hypothetical protein